MLSPGVPMETLSNEAAHSFAVVPLILFTSDRKKMGSFVNPLWIKLLAWLTAGIIILLNIKYLFDQLMSLFH